MRKAIKEIYKNRQSFVVIGLTGKIGSGCSTVANFLTQNSNEHNLSSISLSCSSSDNDRKDFIVQNFYKEHWNNFTKITVSDVMTHFIFSSPYKNVKSLIRESFAEHLISKKIEEIINEKIIKSIDKNTKFHLNKSLSESVAFKKSVKKLYFSDPKDHKECNESIKKLNKYLVKNKIERCDPEITINTLLNYLSSEKLEDHFTQIKDLEVLHNEINPSVIKQNLKPFNLQDGDGIKNDLDNESAYKYITQDIVKNSNKLKSLFKGYRNYTIVYQKLGDNLRKFGTVNNPLIDGNSVKTNPENIYKLSYTINSFIKIIKRHNVKDNLPTYIVIDSFRNPMEVMFFKERYAGFYLFSINSKQEDIDFRLQKINEMHEDEVRKQSSKEEDVEALANIDYFTSQNIRDCIQKADIHISNDGQNLDSCKETLYRKIIKYTSLIMHPGLITPSQDEKMMQIAYTAKLNSGCLSRQVGAAVTNFNGSLVSIGWNSVAQGQTPCLLRNKVELLRIVEKEQDLEKYSAYSDFEKSTEFSDAIQIYSKPITDEDKPINPFKEEYSYKGLNQSFCFKSIYNKHEDDKNQVHTRSLHAEENAFLQISKYGGEGVKGGTLYSTASPCELCSKKAVQLGITNIVYIDPYPGIAQKQILNAGKEKPKMKLFNGAIGSAYHRLYEQIIPYKDELGGYSTDTCCS
ncbi:hypothetical protein [Thiomicrorhabdus indica]|uniref:hypothetical protein n=1 Tax=Thiomicrorhabdus indica TaxID=2267253 RepID=UPI002AA71A00|nr:hypothetical protein [Thiomicrorhabdus indica]